MPDEADDARRREVFAGAWHGEGFRPPSTAVRAEFGARSHRGRAALANEDHHLVLRLGRHQETVFTSLSPLDAAGRFDESAYVAFVADGLGGKGAGAVASRVALSTVAELLVRFGRWNMRIDAATAAEIIERSEWLYRRTHETVLTQRMQHAELGHMATTLTGFYSAGTDLFVAHVGHSRCYLFRNGELTQLTADQTLRERFATSRQPAAVNHAIEDLQHILTDALGGRSDPSVSVEHFQLLHDDCLLLCTNGLTDMVDDDSIADVLACRRAPLEQCDLLVDLALAKGGADNATVVIGQYDVSRGAHLNT